MMIAVIADIHGNYVALQTCIEYALEKNVTSFIFLGDYVGELAYPQKTMDILYKLSSQYKCYFIKGNKEDYWLKYRMNGNQGWKDNDSTTGSLLYTYHHLTEKDLSFFEGLSIKQDLAIGSMPLITICHGSPDKVNEKLLPDSERTFEVMKKSEASIILCAHTHIEMKIQHNGKTVLNPGSVGVPLHSDGKTQFLILHETNNNWEEEFVSLDYETEKVIYDLHESGLDVNAPYWCKVTENLLLHGDVSHGSVLAKAMSLCVQERGECHWPDVPEQYWEQAVNDMIP